MITKDNQFVYETTLEMIDTNFILEQLNRFSTPLKSTRLLF